MWLNERDTTGILNSFGGKNYFRRIKILAENNTLIFGGTMKPPKIICLFSAASGAAKNKSLIFGGQRSRRK